jgi:hypothetical protein
MSDILPFVWLWYGEPNATGNAIGYAKHRSRTLSIAAMRLGQNRAPVRIHG